MAGQFILNETLNLADLLSVPEADENDAFGHAVALDGDTLVVGAWGKYGMGGPGQGAAFVFGRIDGNWVREAELRAEDGEAYDRFGDSVAVSGDTIVVGAPDHEVGGGSLGVAYVFVRDGMTWTQAARLTSLLPAVDDRFAWSVAVSGNTIVVGDFRDSELSRSEGAVYVFEKPAGGWSDMTQTAKLRASDASEHMFLGYSVSVSGDKVAAGAIGYNRGQGAVYVFVKPFGGWVDATQSATLTTTDGEMGDNPGSAVSISFDTIAALSSYGGALDRGSAYVFVRPPGGWIDMTQTATLSNSDADIDLRWVYALSAGDDGRVVVVGGPSLSPSPGNAYVFERPDTGWADTLESAKLTPYDGAERDSFGRAVAVTAGAVAVGAPGDDGAFEAQGSAYVFTEPPGGWIDSTDATKLALSGVGDLSGNDDFGSAVSMSNGTAVVGASGDNQGAGAAYVFVREAAAWILQAKLTASDGAAQDSFGCAVAIEGDVLVVGADGDDITYDAQGSAYVFVRNGSVWTQQAKLTASNPQEWDRFGYSVAISGTTIAIGALYANEAAARAGAAYLYQRPGANWTDMTESARLIPSDGSSYDRFGGSVSVFGSNVVVGAYSDAPVFAGQGSAYVFREPATGWTSMTQTAKLTASDGGEGDRFGAGVGVFGDFVAVGAPFHDAYSGAVYQFIMPPSGWTDAQAPATLFATDDPPYPEFGHSLSLSVDRLLVGAYGDGPTYQEGSAYYFVNFPGGSNSWIAGVKLRSAAPAQQDLFGYSVAIEGDIAIVGAPYDDNAAGANAGSTFVFDVADGDVDGIPDSIDNCVAVPNPDQVDTNHNGIGNACELCCPLLTIEPELTADDRGTLVESTKNRFLSFVAANGGENPYAIEVRLINPPPFDIWNGMLFWVGDPREICEVSGTGLDKPCPPGAPKAWVAPLVCSRVCRSDWDQYGVIHVYHQAVVPGGTHSFLVDCSCYGLWHPLCDPFFPFLSTSAWGDVSGRFADGAWTAADGTVDVTVDVVAVLEKFRNGGSAPGKVRADVEPACIDFQINISDVTTVLDAFRGRPYPFAPGSGNCPSLDPCAYGAAGQE